MLLQTLAEILPKLAKMKNSTDCPNRRGRSVCACVCALVCSPPLFLIYIPPQLRLEHVRPRAPRFHLAGMCAPPLFFSSLVFLNAAVAAGRTRVTAAAAACQGASHWQAQGLLPRRACWRRSGRRRRGSGRVRRGKGAGTECRRR
jgi:hypothetical protein